MLILLTGAPHSAANQSSKRCECNDETFRSPTCHPLLTPTSNTSNTAEHSNTNPLQFQRERTLWRERGWKDGNYRQTESKRGKWWKNRQTMSAGEKRKHFLKFYCTCYMSCKVSSSLFHLHPECVIDAWKEGLRDKINHKYKKLSFLPVLAQFFINKKKSDQPITNLSCCGFWGYHPIATLTTDY